MKIFMTLCISLCLSAMIAQEGIHIQINDLQRIDDDKRQCVSIDVHSNTEEKFVLSSQNYRLYYNSDNIHLDEQSLGLLLPNEDYQLRLVQHVTDVNAVGTGNLSFENSLGFINFSIVQNKIHSTGVAIGSKLSSIAQMCFEVEEFDKRIAIVLAREDATSQYGRAFIELSSLDRDNLLKSTNVLSYSDYIIQ